MINSEGFMSGFMDCFGISDIGLQRKANEDQFLIADVCKSMRVHQTSLGLEHQTRLFGNTQGKLLVVADGMGGHDSGERASQLVLDTIVDYVLNRLSWLLQIDPESEDNFVDQLKMSLISCQNRINKESMNIPSHRKMGSTLTLVYVVWPKAFVIHVGDSRCYLMRHSQLQQMTRDHTLAQLAKDNTIGGNFGTAIENQVAKGSSLNHVLWNVIGGGSEKPHPDALAIDLQIGDTLLLCTDGLTNAVNISRIQKLLSEDSSATKICRQLVDEAIHAGGADNTTVVVSRFLKEMPQETLMQVLEEPIPETLDTEIMHQVGDTIRLPI